MAAQVRSPQIIDDDALDPWVDLEAFALDVLDEPSDDDDTLDPWLRDPSEIDLEDMSDEDLHVAAEHGFDDVLDLQDIVGSPLVMTHGNLRIEHELGAHMRHHRHHHRHLSRLGAVFGPPQFRQIQNPIAAQRVVAAARGSDKKKALRAQALLFKAHQASKKGDPSAKRMLGHVRQAVLSEVIVVQPGGMLRRVPRSHVKGL
jgi:hypothetical protein